MGFIVVLGLILIGVFGHDFLSKEIQRISITLEGRLVSPAKGRELQGLMRGYFTSSGGSILLPIYKFFTPFYQEIRELQLRHGLRSKELLCGLRPWLGEDVQFEEKVQALFKNSIVQFLILSLFTWVFYFNANHSLGSDLSCKGFSILQVLGFLSFSFVYLHQKKKAFGGMEELLRRVLIFKSLKTVGLSMGEVLAKSKADQEMNSSQKKVKELGNQMMDLTKVWTKEGKSIDGELEEFLNELIFVRNEQCRKFELKLGALRFIHLVVFYLFGYFLVILGLIRQLALSY